MPGRFESQVFRRLLGNVVHTKDSNLFIYHSLLARQRRCQLAEPETCTAVQGGIWTTNIVKYLRVHTPGNNIDAFLGSHFKQSSTAN